MARPKKVVEPTLSETLDVKPGMPDNLPPKYGTGKRGAHRPGLSVERMCAVVPGSGGYVTAIAKRLGIANSTLHEYTRKYPELLQAIEDERERMLDFAESKLQEKIRNNDTIAILFFLKTQGKKRGYIEKTESEVNNTGGGTSLEIVLTPNAGVQAQQTRPASAPPAPEEPSKEIMQ